MPPIVQKRLLGKEDCDFDFNGTNETRTTIDGSGNSIEVTKLNDSHIPLLAALRAEVGGATTINGALTYLSTGLNGIGSATLTEEGLIEIADSAEMLALTDPDRAVTPAGLSLLIPSESQKGIIQMASQAEVDAGSVTNKAVAPATLPSPASTAEAQAGTDDSKKITPLKLHETMLAGVEQSWTDVTGSRSLGVTYTNSTGRPIVISVTNNTTSDTATVELNITIDGAVRATQHIGRTDNVTDEVNITTIVPNGSTYSADGASVGQLLSWQELR